MIRYVRKEMIYPINRMVDGMNLIDLGEYTTHIEANFRTREFSHLKDSFNKLMDEITHLKIQAYEKIIELKDAELRNLQLQIRPHFFLNAITTILSLSSQNKHGQAEAYAGSLSKNIRYMFKSRLHTVTVKEEIRHTENYFVMQNFKYEGYTFHYVELPVELEDWRIPQMLIQTFIENEFKHAVSADTVLTILIKIGLDKRQGEEMLLIEIEDDGKGYPENVLAYMNKPIHHTPGDGSRIGLLNIKYMMELMYERTDLIAVSNLEPHGCLNRIWVPKIPLHEYEEADMTTFIEKG
jgi:sensor histidine kinase YesM